MREDTCARTRIPGLVREHRADKANDDIVNSARTKGCGLKTRRIPRTLSALQVLLVELSIHGFYWIFATLAHAQNKSWYPSADRGALLTVFENLLSFFGKAQTLRQITAKTGLIGNGANTGGVNEASSPPWWRS